VVKRRLALLLGFALIATTSFAQEQQAITVTHLPTSLAGQWLFRIGHDPSWASPFRERRSWQRITVPGSWERQGFPGYDGHAWYRLPFFIDSQLAGQELGLDLGMIGDVDEVFLNGRRVGVTGSFPPRFETAPLVHRFYAIPSDTVRFGEYNELAIHVYNNDRAGGLLGPPPRIDRYRSILFHQVMRDMLVYCLFAFLATLALAQLALFFTHRERYEHLALAGFMTFSGIYVLTYTSWGPITLLGYSLTFRLNVATFLLSVALFPVAIVRLVRRPVPSVVVAVQTLLALGAAFALAWPEETDLVLWIYLAEAAVVVAAAVAIRAIIELFRRRSPWATWLAVTTSALLVTASLDVLVDLGVIGRRVVLVGELYTPLALVPFAIVLSLATAYEWARARWGEPADVAVGVLSRDRFFARLATEIDRTSRGSQTLALALMRIDLHAPHEQEVALLATTILVLRRALRQIDLLGRHDHLTFAILLAETDERTAVGALERLRRAVSDGLGLDRAGVRVSAGVTQYRASREPGPRDLLGEAEAALFAAISEGGDCTATAP
jgi:GGDEF domain-containing protein